MPAILQAAADAGAQFAGYTILRLPWTVAPVFEAWVEAHFPERKEKVLNRIREIRDGKLNDPRWFSRTRGSGAFARQLSALFDVCRRKTGLDGEFPELTSEHFQRPAGPQISLF